MSLIRVFSYVSDESSLGEARDKVAATCAKDESGAILGCPDRSPTSPQWAALRSANAAYKDNEQSAKDGAPLTVGVGVVGLLLIGGGIYLFASAPSASSAGQASPPNTLRMRVIPQVGVRESGLSVVGSF